MDAGLKQSAEDEAAAWRSVWILYRHVLPLGAVLRREKPLSALVGSRHLAVMAAGMVTNILVLDQYNNVLRRLAATIYLRDWAIFKRQISLALVLSFVYSFVQIGSARLYIMVAALWRRKLTRAVQGQYMRSSAYYRLQQQSENGGGAIIDADQRITEDVKEVTMTLAGMCYRTMAYTSNLFGSVLRLALLIHPKYIFICFGYLLVCGRVRERAVPAMRLGLLNGEISRTMGEYMSAQLRVQENCEPIVTLRGTQAEKQRILDAYRKMEQTQIEFDAETSKDAFWYSGVITIVTTPTLQALLVEVPFISPSGPRVHASSQEGLEANAGILGEMTFVNASMKRLMTYTRAMLMLRRIVLSSAGRANRLVELLDACDQMVSGPLNRRQSSVGSQLSSATIKLQRLTVQRPDCGSVMVRALDIDITAGRNLLVVGESGVGKTSLFRTISGLWKSPTGCVCIPSRYDEEGRMMLCFLPQSSYCPLGSLQDAVTYPLYGQSLSSVELKSLLSAVELDDLIDRDKCDWDATLTVSQKQRLGIARLLYHKPRFCVLDECTSTLSEDMADRVYQLCASARTTVITVSHRPKHKRFHSRILTLKGAGHWDVAEISAEDVVPTPPATPRSPSSFPVYIEESLSNGSPLCSNDEYQTRMKIRPWKLKPMPQMSSIRRMALVVRICLPELSLTNRSTQLIWLHIASIMLNVFLTSKILASLPGRLQALAIQSDRARYFDLTVRALGFRLLCAVTTNLAARSGYSLARQFKRVLTECVTEKAMGGDNAFYTLRQVDKRIMDMETRVVSDIDLCGKAMQLLLQSMLKPLSSAMVVTRMLVSANLSLSAISIIYLYALTGSVIVRFASPDLGGFAAMMSQMEGIFRRMHRRVIAHCDSIAMIGGEEPECNALDLQSDAIAEEQRRQTVAQIRFDSGNYWFNNYLPQVITNTLRMSWSSSNYGSADQVMAEGGGTGLSAQGLYIENLVTEGFAAVTEILSINTSFRTFAGYARRISDLVLVIDEVRSELAEQEARTDVRRGSTSTDCNGVTTDHNDEVIFSEVDIVAPDGQQIVSKLTLRLAHGEHLRVSGPNGCGKSLFRALAGTWHSCAGFVHAPLMAAMLPQQPLVTATPISLIAYVTYPQPPDASDSQRIVAELLEQLGIHYLAEREGLSSCRLWSDVLSLGELQCLGCARILYHLLGTSALSRAAADAGTMAGRQAPEHCPYRWAILDECTFAMDAAVEKSFFRYAASQEISLLSFSQRESAAVVEDQAQEKCGRTRLLTLGVGALGWELD